MYDKLIYSIFSRLRNRTERILISRAVREPIIELSRFSWYVIFLRIEPRRRTRSEINRNTLPSAVSCSYFYERSADAAPLSTSTNFRRSGRDTEDTHFNLRTNQVQKRVCPESLALVDLPADLFSPHAAQETNFFPRQWCCGCKLDRLCHVRQWLLSLKGHCRHRHRLHEGNKRETKRERWANDGRELLIDIMYIICLKSDIASNGCTVEREKRNYYQAIAITSECISYRE